MEEFLYKDELVSLFENQFDRQFEVSKLNIACSREILDNKSDNKNVTFTKCYV